MLVCCNTPIATALTDYFEHRVSYQETVALLHLLRAEAEIIRSLPQGAFEFGGFSEHDPNPFLQKPEC